MNKKIKVIELLNQLSKGNIYEKIKYDEEIYKWSYSNEYRDENGNRRLTDKWKIEQILNDEVEILEDEEEIDIQILEEIPIHKDEFGCEKVSATDIIFAKEINGLIRAVKQLDKKINKEE